jgi:hypothetical protein
MDISFDIDFDTEEINIIVDNTLTLRAYKNSDGRTVYKRFENIESDDVQDKIKSVCAILFTLNE